MFFALARRVSRGRTGPAPVVCGSIRAECTTLTSPPALKRHDETRGVSLHPKTRRVFEDEDSTVGVRLRRVPGGNLRVCAQFFGTFVRVWFPRPLVVAPLESHGPCHRPDFAIAVFPKERLRCGEVRVPLEATQTRERVLMSRRVLGRTAVRTRLGSPRFRADLNGDAVLLGGTP